MNNSNLAPMSSTTSEMLVPIRSEMAARNHMREYLFVLRKRWMLIVLVTIFFASAGIFYTIRLPNLYQATSTVAVNLPESRYIGDVKVEGVQFAKNSYINTQKAILTSQLIAQKVLHRLQMNDDFSNAMAQDFCGRTKEQITPALLLKSLEVASSRDSDVLEIRCIGGEPKSCAVIANLFVETFIEEDRRRSESGQSLLQSWLKKEIPRIEQEIVSTREKLLHFEKNNKEILFVSSHKEIPAGIIERLRQELQEVKIRLLTAEIRYKKCLELQDKGSFYALLALDFFQGNSLIDYLRQRELELENTLNEYRLKYKDKHPKIIWTKKTLASFRNKISQEAKALIQKEKQAYLDLLQKKKQLEKMLQNEQQRYIALKQNYLEYERHRREYEALQKTYSSFVEKAKELDSTINYQVNNIQLIDHAQAPKEPYYPQREKNYFLSLALGLFAGIGLSFMFEHFDQRIHSPEEIQEIMEVPSLGFVPYAGKEQPKDLAMLVDHQERSPAAEAFRTIATSLFYGENQLEKSVLLVSSASDGEGKTNTLCNLGLVIAKTGYRVLLVDGDLYKPQIHKRLGLDAQPGLSELLQKKNTLEEVVQPLNERVSVVTAGELPPNPYDCVINSQLHEVFAEMRSHYDCVLIDTSPLGMTSDPLVFSKKADGVILVVSLQKSNKRMLEQIYRRLQTLQVSLRGFILNDKKGDYVAGQSYYHYYGYHSRSYYHKDAR